MKNPESLRPSALMYVQEVKWANRTVEDEAKRVLNEKDTVMRDNAAKFLINGIKLAERPTR